MDEPVGTVIESAPWVESRGPHLPDALTRVARTVPIPAWIFIVIAIVDLGWNLQRLGLDATSDPYTVAQSVVGWLPSIATCLFGAGLFVRHRHAWSTHRLLVVGIVTLVVVEALQAASVIYATELSTLWHPTDDLSPIGLGTLAVSIIIAFLRVIGLALVARGVLAVRQFEEDLNADRRMTIITLFSLPLVVVSVASVVLYTSTLDLTTLGLTTIAYLILGAFVSALAVAALAYLTTIVTAGWAARERPRGGWRFAALAVWLILLALYVGTTVNVVALVISLDSQASAPDWLVQLFFGSSIVRSIGYGCLLLAFVFAFPSPGDEPAEPEDLED